MKIFILLLSSLVISLYAKNNYELRLYESIFPLLFEKSVVYVYLTKDNHDKIFNGSQRIVQIRECKDADFVFIKSRDYLPSECLEKPIFATKYRYIRDRDVFGVFYWKKGRPQLLFSKDALSLYHLSLPQSLVKYAY